MGRGGWLFADTPKGAQASAITYSIVVNNLNVFQYLKYLFENLPNINFVEQPDMLEKYLPWSESLPDYCHNKI